MNLGASCKEVEQGQEADLDILDVPTTINRTNKDKSDNEYSSDDSDEGSSLSSAQQMSDGDDGSSMLVEDDVSVSSDGSEQDLNDERDKVVAEMYAHTLAWNTQRDYVQKRMDEAKTDVVNTVPWPDQHGMFVCDYAPNMDLPHFGGE